MAKPLSKLGWKIVSAAIAAPVGIAAGKAVATAWEGLRPTSPPNSPTDPDAGLTDILGWAAISAVGIAIGQYAASRAAATVWRGLTGDEPPA